MQKLALLAAEAAGDDDVDDDAHVPAPSTAERGHALAAQRDDLARLRAGLELQRGVAFERRHLQGRAESGEGSGDIYGGDEVIAVAHEALVLAHPHEHIQIARARAQLASVAATGKADALPIGDARRNLDLERALR